MTKLLEENQDKRSGGENRPASRVGRVKAILFVAVFLVLLFAAAELILAVFGVETGSGLPGGWKAFSRKERRIARSIERAHRRLGAKAYRIPDSIVYLYKPLKSEYCNKNELGFRGGEVEPKADNEFRIMVMGGSTVYGQRVADDATIPAYLEKALSAKHPDRKIKVFNTGVESYVFRNEIAFAKRLAPELKPDLIVFYSGANDVEYAFTAGYRRPEPYKSGIEVGFARPRTFGARIRDLLYRSRVFQILRPALRRFIRSDRFEADDAVLSKNLESYVQGYLQDVRATTEEFAAKSIDVLFAVQPTLFYKKDLTPEEEKIARILVRTVHGPRYPEFYKQCAARLVESGLVEDLTHALDGCKKQVYWDSIHLNPLGNRIVAERLAEVIERRGFLKGGDAAP